MNKENINHAYSNKELINKGKIIKIVGPVVLASGMSGSRMYESVKVGEEALFGEIITLEKDIATIQVYEETTGLIPGQEVTPTGRPLSVELGPGLLGTIYDGVQRPLEVIRDSTGDMIHRGSAPPPLDRDKRWTYYPLVEQNSLINGGQRIGYVQESESIRHFILLPPYLKGVCTFVLPTGDYQIETTIIHLKTTEGEVKVPMYQRWPVREARPIHERIDPILPLITGQRIIDTLFPLAQGGTAAIPGPFGSGKTVVQQQLAKWVNADIIVYIGCGERGNEMADVLDQFPKLHDPKTGQPLIKRMVLIANTSNMPVAAREASVYTGITIAEYYRDMGYDVAVMADSTSRWAEAMREISGRLEEMPGEEGYPAYLSSRLAEFYERAGRARLFGDPDRIGSISVIGAVSPPGGDFSEPVTQNTLRLVKVFWALDAELAYLRHFPAINWMMSYSLYTKLVDPWWQENGGPDFTDMRQEMFEILQKESELEEIIRLVGPETLPEQDKLILVKAEIIKESYLMQYAFHPVDTYSAPKRQYLMLKAIFSFFKHAQEAIEKGADADSIRNLSIRSKLARMGSVPSDKEYEFFLSIEAEIQDLSLNWRRSR